MGGNRHRGQPDKKQRKSLLTKKRERETEEQDIQQKQVEIASILVRKLKMSKTDVSVAYDDFHKKFPNGEITKEDFLDLEENKVGETEKI